MLDHCMDLETIHKGSQESNKNTHAFLYLDNIRLAHISALM